MILVLCRPLRGLPGKDEGIGPRLTDMGGLAVAQDYVQADTELDPELAAVLLNLGPEEAHPVGGLPDCNAGPGGCMMTSQHGEESGAGPAMSSSDSLLESSASDPSRHFSFLSGTGAAVVRRADPANVTEPLQGLHPCSDAARQLSGSGSRRSIIDYRLVHAELLCRDGLQVIRAAAPEHGQFYEVTFHASSPMAVPFADENAVGACALSRGGTLPVVARLAAQGHSAAVIQSSMAHSVEHRLAPHLFRELGPCWRGKAAVHVRPAPVGSLDWPSLTVAVTTANSAYTASVVGHKILEWFDKL